MLAPALGDPASPERASTLFVAGLSSLAGRYDLVLCDVWGVLHDGVTAFTAAADALTRFRAGGGRVVLVSNAPRPGHVVTRQLDQLGVKRSAYDAIRTSGDLTRTIVAEHGARPVHHIGPDRDLKLFEGLDARFAPLAEAEYVVCTGLIDDETETVADYGARLRAMRERDLLMVCANPDLVVERGLSLIPCAGALAAAYEALGGRVVMPGKPHPPIYEAALALGSGLLGRPVEGARVLAVGDAMRTDVAGGDAAGLDTLLVARGIHAGEIGFSEGELERELALGWLSRQPVQPTWVATTLSWS